MDVFGSIWPSSPERESETKSTTTNQTKPNISNNHTPDSDTSNHEAVEQPEHFESSELSEHSDHSEQSDIRIVRGRSNQNLHHLLHLHLRQCSLNPTPATRWNSKSMYYYLSDIFYHKERSVSMISQEQFCFFYVEADTSLEANAC